VLEEDKDKYSSNIEIDSDNVNFQDGFTVILVRIFANSIRILVKFPDFSNI